MQRYHITLGASTSSGGKVISASSCCSINGVRMAVEGDKIFCPACKSSGTIAVFGPRIPESWNGKEAALQDDLCICKCSPPPRLIANQSLKCQVIDSAGEAGPSACELASQVREAAQAAALGAEDDQLRLRLRDDLTQVPIVHKSYRLVFGDQIIEGQTDAEGYTQPIPAAARIGLIAWHIME